MKMIKCSDAGFKDCPSQITGETDDEVIRNAQQHGMKAHNRQPRADDAQKLRPMIKNV
jgi:predicted small metal-binding protein